MRGRLAAAILVIAGVGLTACTADAAPPQATPRATSEVVAPQAPTTPTPPPDEVEIPVVHDAGHADAVATFGGDRVRSALADDARIARIALADCGRWRTGTVDPELTALVDPTLLARAQAELDRPPGMVPSLLSALPTDDGNGTDEAAAVVQGCAGGPLQTGPGPAPTLRVDRGTGAPRLVLDAGFWLVVAFGDTRVGAGQDWTFTSTPTAAGWQLTDAAAEAQVDWFPAPPA